jgi:DNA-binding NarL/FixJ family response regulator
MANRGPEDLVRDGLEALAAADWDAAKSSFEQAQQLEPSPEALDGLSEVANFQGEYERSIELKEEAFREFRKRNQPTRAADVARWLAFMYATYHGNFSVASGWMGRAQSLMEGTEESAAHGWLVLDRAPFSRDPAEREQLATAALAIARRYGDTDLEFEAVALLGESYVASGRIDEGMALLDQAMAAITGREISDHKVMGEIYCRLLSACEQALDVRRAEEWVAAVDRYIAWRDFVRPTCRTHYGGILVALGRWAEAETELVAAVEAFERGYRGDRAFPLIRLADLRVRQGRFEEAERLLEGQEWHPTARRAAATIAWGRGNLELAEELARLCFEGGESSDPASCPALELLVMIQVASGNLAAASETRDRLATLASEAGSDRLQAMTELASGLVRAAADDEAASAHLKRALEAFAALQLPLETARCRLELARALAQRQPDAAAYEGRLALQAFEDLGASRDADAAGEVLRGIGVSGRSWPKGSRSLTKREREVLALLAEGLPNAEIADRLYISVRTAEHHVASILGKLDLRSRAEAAAYAIRDASRKEP